MERDLDIVAELHGVRVPAAPHLTQRTIEAIRSGLYERPEIEGVLVNLRAGDRVVELGSGAGIVSSIIAKTFDDVQVRTFEGNPDLIEHIRRMHSVNGLEGAVEVRNSIVVSEDDPPPFTLFSVSSSFLGSRLAEAGASDEDGRSLRVEITPYAELCRSFPHNVLVMDIEGAELAFLRGADLAGIDVLIVELHPTVYGQDMATECIRLIEAGGLVLDPASSTLQVKAFKTPGRMRLGIDTTRVAWRDMPEALEFGPDTECAAGIEVHPGAVLVKSPGFGPDPVAASVFDADQREVPVAISWFDGTSRATLSRHHPRMKRVSDIGGTWVFGGTLDPEAPDALRQMLARLWCLSHLDAETPPGGVVYVPLGAAGQDVYDAFLAQALPLWAPGLKPLVLKGPSRFERLIVPPQGVASGRLRHGTAEFRAFARSRDRGAPPAGAGGSLFLFDSRAGDGETGTVAQATLADAGYATFDLARGPLSEAAEMIGASSVILAAGGAAEDLVLYLARDTARIGTLDSAEPGTAEDFETLARLHGFADAHRIDLGGKGHTPGASARDRLRLHLAVQGFL
ncbi:FkbM family methyltransferase [Rhodobacterales bacterium HKCCSP123]|nr:FkbM family methyltransferase [Rhodobacterales bacterium HKCCSP123]